MAADLIVGPLDSDIEDRVLRICRRLGLRNWPPTDSPIGLNPRMTTSGAQRMTENVMISVLNNASLDAFNTFAAGLEGFSEHDAMTKTALRNLPWWLQFFGCQSSSIRQRNWLLTRVIRHSSAAVFAF